MEEFVGYIVRNVVEDPDRVTVTTREENDQKTIELRVADEDVARLIGRKGRTIQAIRVIAGTVAARHEQRVRVEVLDGKEEKSED